MKRYKKIASIVEQIQIGWDDNNNAAIKFQSAKLEHINFPHNAKVLLSNDDPGEVFLLLQRSHIIEVRPDLIEEIMVTGNCKDKNLLKMTEFLMGEF